MFSWLLENCRFDHFYWSERTKCQNLAYQPSSNFFASTPSIPTTLNIFILRLWCWWDSNPVPVTKNRSFHFGRENLSVPFFDIGHPSRGRCCWCSPRRNLGSTSTVWFEEDREEKNHRELTCANLYPYPSLWVRDRLGQVGPSWFLSLAPGFYFPLSPFEPNCSYQNVWVMSH